MRAIGVIAISLASMGCTNELSGKVSVESKANGDFAIEPTECVSGQREGFFGVDLRQGSSGDKIVRLINDPKDGYTVKVNVPKSKKALVLSEASKCKRFETKVERQNSEINSIHNVRGHIKLTCKVGEDEVAADVQFANCH